MFVTTGVRKPSQERLSRPFDGTSAVALIPDDFGAPRKSDAGHFGTIIETLRAERVGGKTFCIATATVFGEFSNARIADVYCS
jgi:hypothetical protein